MQGRGGRHGARSPPLSRPQRGWPAAGGASCPAMGTGRRRRVPARAPYYFPYFLFFASKEGFHTFRTFSSAFVLVPWNNSV